MAKQPTDALLASTRWAAVIVIMVDRESLFAREVLVALTLRLPTESTTTTLQVEQPQVVGAGDPEPQ